MSDKVVYEVDLDVPGRPKGDQIQIAGLGTFSNGDSHEITDDQAQAFRVSRSTTEPVLGDDDEVLGSERVLGPTLLQASKNMNGVSVTTVTSSKGGDE